MGVGGWGYGGTWQCVTKGLACRATAWQKDLAPSAAAAAPGTGGTGFALVLLTTLSPKVWRMAHGR